MKKEINQTTFKIMMRTGRFPIECSCAECQKQCKTPCLGTPKDILDLIEAGYVKDLTIAFWAVGYSIGEISAPVLMVQPKRTERGCIFFKQGKCEIHNKGLKPTEGTLSHHTITMENFSFKRSLTWNVAKEWLLEHNVPYILKILDAFVEFKREEVD